MEAVDHKSNKTEDRIRELVEQVIMGSSAFVVGVEVRGSRGSGVINVYVDSDEGMGVDELARISRDLELLLDADDPMPGRYSLNVSSPGADKPLAMPRQYRKNVGRRLRVHYRRDDDAGNVEASGTLVDVDDEAIGLEVSDDEIRRIAFDRIIWAKVQLPW